MVYILAIIIGYLLGCSNLAYYLARFKRVDMRGQGSGNLGASNTVVLMGWKHGAAVAIHDILKALFAVLIAQWLFPDILHIGAVAGVAAVLGHIFPFYLKFRGGKGFASFIGMTAALNWKLAIAVLVLVLVVTIITDYIVCGTVSTIISVPIYLGIVHKSPVLSLIILLATAVILYKHRENFVRIHKRTEIGLSSALRGEHRQ